LTERFRQPFSEHVLAARRFLASCFNQGKAGSHEAMSKAQLDREYGSICAFQILPAKASRLASTRANRFCYRAL
jgi:hypothetical protein